MHRLQNCAVHTAPSVRYGTLHWNASLLCALIYLFCHWCDGSCDRKKEGCPLYNRTLWWYIRHIKSYTCNINQAFDYSAVGMKILIKAWRGREDFKIPTFDIPAIIIPTSRDFNWVCRTIDWVYGDLNWVWRAFDWICRGLESRFIFYLKR